MKAMILAGGYGTRISEESHMKPKPMVEIGGKPILWHIMKIYSAHGINDFIICCGYKSQVIKEYFAHYYLHNCDITFDLQNQKIEVHQSHSEPWKVTLVDTGEGTMTGGRVKRAVDYIGQETFCLTYGDGVADIDIKRLIEFHITQKTLATLTAVQRQGRFGLFHLANEQTKITNFSEKPPGDSAWINGGFFVLEPQVTDYIAGDATVWEQEPLTRLAKDGMLSAYRHDGFWHALDTLHDKNVLEQMWQRGNPPWKIWSHQP
jgi:glucose-1-phosphate cytidylyltransferase